MTVLNEQKLAFRDMTPEERSEIVEALLIGQVQSYVNHKEEWFDNGIQDFINPLSVYRTKSKQLVIPWDVIKPEYKWAVVGFEGATGVVLYQEKPFIQGDAWNYASTMEVIVALNIDTAGIN